MPNSAPTVAIAVLAGISAALAGGEVADPPAAYWADRAAVEHRYGREDDAVAAYQRAAAGESDPAARRLDELGLAASCAAAGDRDRARALWTGLADDASPAIAAEATFALARDDQRRGDVTAAIARLEPLALGCPIALIRGGAIDALADAYRARGGVGDAIVALDARLARRPGDLALIELVDALDPSPVARVRRLARAVAAVPGDGEAAARYAEALADAHLDDRARDAFARLASDHPERARAAAGQLARLAAARGDADGAVHALEAADPDAPADARHALWLARELLALRLWPQAETAARDACARSADEGPAQLAAARIELAEALVREGAAEADALLRPLAAQDAWPGIRSRARALLAAARPADRGDLR